MRASRMILLAVVVAAVGAGTAVFHTSILRTVFAVGLATVIVRVGWSMLGGLAEPVPEPPPAGSLRKVKLVYRCPSCGAEVRMTAAASEDPDPPRHCMDDMELVSPVE